MGKELDIDDVCYGHPLAEKELMRLRVMLGRCKDIDCRIQTAIDSAFERVDTRDTHALSDCAQIVDREWLNPSWGCDTLQHFIDALRDCRLNEKTKPKPDH